MEFNKETYTITNSGKLGTISLVIGILFLAISVVGYLADSAQFFLNYLTAFMFWLTIALGGLFFTLLHHITGAKWSTVIRRISENMASTMPLFALLFIPIVFGLHDLYHWSHAEVMDPSSESFDALLYTKKGFLNPTFFYIRSAVYLVIWILFSFLLRKASIKQDTEHTATTYATFKKISAPGMILFALSTTFASFDWLMALDAHWFSTIFGVYFFSGTFLSGLSFMVLVLVYLRSNSILKSTVSVEHYHDLGKLIFAFIIFWSYMAFSQYFLIWYANLPEENYWFIYRWDNTWESVSMLLIFGHFVFPFLALLTRASKRSIPFLTFMAVWVLAMRFTDLYWLVLPTHHRDGIHATMYDIAPFIGIGGLFVWYFWRQMTANPILPVGDPSLETSKKFLNS